MHRVVAANGEGDDEAVDEASRGSRAAAAEEAILGQLGLREKGNTLAVAKAIRAPAGNSPSRDGTLAGARGNGRAKLKPEKRTEARSRSGPCHALMMSGNGALCLSLFLGCSARCNHRSAEPTPLNHTPPYGSCSRLCFQSRASKNKRRGPYQRTGERQQRTLRAEHAFFCMAHCTVD